MNAAMPGFLTRAQRLLTGSEWWSAAAILAFGVVVTPYANLPSAGPVHSAALLAGGALLLLCLLRWIPRLETASAVDALARVRPWQILLPGLAVHCAAAVATAPIPVSDFNAYLTLASRLAGGESYEFEGRLAFWPPGMPLYLTPFVAVLGRTLLTVIAANAFLFLAGGWALHVLGRRLFSPTVASIALALYCVWPSRILSAGLASKENLTFALVTCALALCTVALVDTDGRPRDQTRLWPAIASGVALGFAALAQPGLLLLALALPLALRHWLRARSAWIFGAAFALGYGTVVAPWHVRNCVVFDGQFCGIATNGGSVMYRANNPKATGSFMPEGEVPISHLPELEQNRTGFAMAKAWIASNPAAFGRLALRKLQHLLGGDGYGAYWGLLRAGGAPDEARANALASPRFKDIVRSADWISNVFWVLVLSLGVRTCLGLRREHPDPRTGLALLVYPIVYSAVVFAVFESGSRQHIFAFGPMLVLAARALAPRQQPEWRTNP